MGYMYLSRGLQGLQLAKGLIGWMDLAQRVAFEATEVHGEAGERACGRVTAANRAKKREIMWRHGDRWLELQGLEALEKYSDQVAH